MRGHNRQSFLVLISAFAETARKEQKKCIVNGKGKYAESFIKHNNVKIGIDVMNCQLKVGSFSLAFGQISYSVLGGGDYLQLVAF